MEIFLINTDTCYWIACPIYDRNAYHKIYKIKKRDLSKPLAIMVGDFNWLSENTPLNKEQINFLKNYKKPFTIMTDSNTIKLWLNYSDEEDMFINKDIYKKIAIRIAHTKEQKKLIKEVWPIFLTSANLSWEKEIYDEIELKEEFKYYLEKKVVKLIETSEKNSKNQKPSEIFEFVWDSLDRDYIRR